MGSNTVELHMHEALQAELRGLTFDETIDLRGTSKETQSMTVYIVHTVISSLSPIRVRDSDTSQV